MREDYFKVIRRYDDKWWVSGATSAGEFTFWSASSGYNTESEAKKLCEMLNSAYAQGISDCQRQMRDAIGV